MIKNHLFVCNCKGRELRPGQLTREDNSSETPSTIAAMDAITVEDLIIHPPETSEDQIYPPVLFEEQYEHVLRQAIAVICSQEGFTHIHQDAFDHLFQSVVAGIRETCLWLKTFTEGAGRTVSSPHELMFAFQSLGTDVTELIDYFEHMKKTGHHVVIPPIHDPADDDLNNNSITSTVQENEEVKKMREERNIPDWMPPFPPLHSFRQTKVEVNHADSYPLHRTLLAQAHRDSEMSLLSYKLRTYPSTSLFRAYELDVRKEIEEEELASHHNNGKHLDLSSFPVSFNTKIAERIPFTYRLLTPDEDVYGDIYNVLDADPPEKKDGPTEMAQKAASDIWTFWNTGPENKAPFFDEVDAEEAQDNSESDASDS
uniref:Transcription initiation factor TFIID subunit 8 n=1 Tax=Steinernema glaseri TaxID=37863 RepID=A0A1I8AS17_9BILA